MKNNNKLEYLRLPIAEQKRRQKNKIQAITLLVSIAVFVIAIAFYMLTGQTHPVRAIFEDEGIYFYEADSGEIIQIADSGFVNPVLYGDDLIMCVSGDELWSMELDGENKTFVQTLPKVGLTAYLGAVDSRLAALDEQSGQVFLVGANGEYTTYDAGHAIPMPQGTLLFATGADLYIGTNKALSFEDAEIEQLVLSADGRYYALIYKEDGVQTLSTGTVSEVDMAAERGYELQMPEDVSGQISIDRNGKVTVSNGESIWLLQPLIDDFELTDGQLSEDEQAFIALEDKLNADAGGKGLVPRNINWIVTW